MHREEELDFLEQIKIISEVMFVTYKRKGLLILSKNGKGFVEKLDPLNQYKEMVLHFWYKVNWGYFTPGIEIDGHNLAENLQHYQNRIWKLLLESKRQWHDYKEFCWALYRGLNLAHYIDDEFDEEHELLFQINLILFRRNLVRFGCVEVVEGPSKYSWDKEIIKFRPTSLGLYVFNKALFENYL